MRRLLLLLAFFGCGPAAQGPGPSVPDRTTPPASSVVTGSEPEAGRLPRDVEPTRYALALSVDPDLESYGGVVTIDATLSAPRSVIWMHGRDLTVSEAVVRTASGPIEGRWTPQEDDDHFATLTLPRAVDGPIEIELTYSAPFGRALGGIYKVESDEHAYAFTQMEPLSARTAFPCFDDPRFKTPFDVTLRVKTAHVALANTLQASEQIDGEHKTVRFATSQPIPTYLFALAVGPFDVVEGEALPASDVRSRPVPFRGIAPHGRGAELAYTMANAPALLAQLEAYFGIPYPYDKLDLVAVPDFEAGAMENVGLVTFRDTILLVDPATTPTKRMRFWAYIVAHELAHMWFGNLVTMEWWDDLWLNEAFASWIEHTAVAGWHPEYEADVELADWVFSVFGQDSLDSARAIRQPIVQSHDIHNAFDGITYGKGAGVLRMFERFVGAETFQRGIRSYLGAHRFGSATTEDLLGALSEAAGRDVGTPFSTFLTQPGVPSVAATLDCAGETPTVRLEQSRYLPLGSTAERGVQWQIPVCVRYGVGRGRSAETHEQCMLLAAASGEMPLENATSCPSWVHPNAAAAGYYRWSVAPDALAGLVDSRQQLAVTERLALADSLSASFASGRVQGGPVLRAMLRVADDSHRAVATAPLGFFDAVLEDVVDEAHRPTLQARLRRAYATEYRRLGWTGRASEDEDTRIRRGEIVGFLATVAEDPAVRREGERRGRAYVRFGAAGERGVDTAAVPADLAEAAVIVAVQEGDAALFEHVENLLGRTTDGQVRRNLLRGLGSTEDAELGARALGLALSDELRVNEVLVPLGAQIADPSRRDAAWAWLQQNFDALAARLPPSYAGYLPQLMGGACDTATANAVQAFFGSRVESLQGGPRNLAGAVEAIRLCATRAEAQRESVQSFLDGR